MRNSVLGGLVALLFFSGFMALDRTTLHWYVADDPPKTIPVQALTEMTASEAEIFARNHLVNGIGDRVGAERIRFLCEAAERSRSGWIVWCGSENRKTGRIIERIAGYLVSANGDVELLTTFN